ncbi:MAG: hypothetical protein ABI359_06305 [Ginsengibacter sp.]
MATKIYTIAILLLIAIATTFSTCKKGGLGCANTVYNFQIGETLFPDKDSIHVGDTLFLKVDASSMIRDLQSGRTIDYSNTSNLGNVITILKFSGKETPGAIKDFSLSILKGSKVGSIDEASEEEVSFSEQNSHYMFLISAIPKDTGRYVITIGDAANVYRTNDKCTKASFAINFSETDQHFYLLNKWRPDLTLDDNGKRHVYYFKVY